jgi:hypothetical protein
MNNMSPEDFHSPAGYIFSVIGRQIELRHVRCVDDPGWTRWVAALNHDPKRGFNELLALEKTPSAASETLAHLVHSFLSMHDL